MLLESTYMTSGSSTFSTGGGSSSGPEVGEMTISVSVHYCLQETGQLGMDSVT